MEPEPGSRWCRATATQGGGRRPALLAWPRRPAHRLGRARRHERLRPDLPRYRRVHAARRPGGLLPAFAGKCARRDRLCRRRGCLGTPVLQKNTSCGGASPEPALGALRGRLHSTWWIRLPVSPGRNTVAKSKAANEALQRHKVPLRDLGQRTPCKTRPHRPPRDYHGLSISSGSAKTYSAFPPSGWKISGVSWAVRLRNAPPSAAGTAMNCRPSAS